MANPQDYEGLERALEARRAGGASSPTGEHEELADLALQVEALGQRTPALDESAVWTRVDEYVRTTPQSTTAFGWLAGAWAAFIQGGAPRLLAPAGIAALLLVGALALVVLQAPGNASAAFVDDVRELGALTDDALLDGMLSEGELAALAALLDEIQAQAGALGDLDDDDLRAVAAILTVTRDQLGSLTGSGGLAPLLAGLDGIGGEAAAALAANSIETALAVCADADDDDGHEACDEALDVADDACDNLRGDAEDACEDELDEIADADDARRDDDHDDHDDDLDHDTGEHHDVDDVNDLDGDGEHEDDGEGDDDGKGDDEDDKDDDDDKDEDEDEDDKDDDDKDEDEDEDDKHKTDEDDA